VAAGLKVISRNDRNSHASNASFFDHSQLDQAFEEAIG